MSVANRFYLASEQVWYAVLEENYCPGQCSILSRVVKKVALFSATGQILEAVEGGSFVQIYISVNRDKLPGTWRSLPSEQAISLNLRPGTLMRPIEGFLGTC